VGKINHLARCINYIRARATSAGILLASALPTGQVLIMQKGIEIVQIVMNPGFAGGRY
jgi:pentose-5-phosphate-3-epimerase